MKLTIHDRSGNILKVAAYPVGHPLVRFEVRDGPRVAHAEVQYLASADRWEIERRLNELHSNFRIAEHGGQ